MAWVARCSMERPPCRVELFNHFVEHSAIEVHLATAFMTTFYRNIPLELKREMFAWLDEHHVADRTPDMTDEQFHHTTQMHALAPFKAAAWNLPMDVKDQLGMAWEAQFDMLFDQAWLLKHSSICGAGYSSHQNHSKP